MLLFYVILIYKWVENMIFLTGCKGFIGQHFASTIGDSVAVDYVNAFPVLEHFRSWDTIDEIIHLGAISSTTETDINKLHRYNVEYTIGLFEKAIEYQIPVKYASSASVYGQSECGQINPLNYYAITKAQIDYYVQDNIDKFKNICGYRFFNVYGENEEHKKDQASPVSKFTWQARENKTIKVFEGSENYYRDFIYVGDIVDILLNHNQPSGIYDLGTGESTSFQTIAELIAAKEGAEIETIPFPPHLKGKYQNNTCANMNWIDYNFTKIEDYINRPL